MSSWLPLRSFPSIPSPPAPQSLDLVLPPLSSRGLVYLPKISSPRRLRLRQRTHLSLFKFHLSKRTDDSKVMSRYSVFPSCSVWCNHPHATTLCMGNHIIPLLWPQSFSPASQPYVYNAFRQVWMQWNIYPKKKKICCVWRSFLTTTASKEWAADQSRPEEREIWKEKGNLKGYAFEALEKSLPDHSWQPKKHGCVLKKYTLEVMLNYWNDCRKRGVVKTKYQPPSMVLNCFETHSLPTWVNCE